MGRGASRQQQKTQQNQPAHDVTSTIQEMARVAYPPDKTNRFAPHFMRCSTQANPLLIQVNFEVAVIPAKAGIQWRR
jgi:hypothetical protein